MDTGTLDQFHDTGNKDIDTIANCVDFHLFALDILIHKDRLIFVDLNSRLQIMTQLLLIGNDLHRSAAQHEAGANQNRIANRSCSSNTILDLGNGFTLRLRNIQLLQDLLKAVTVFSLLDCCAISTNDLNTTICQRLCQIDRSLTTQRSDNTFRIFKLDDVHNILRSQRLEVQLICSSVVSRNSLRVIVDNNSFIAGILDSCNRMDSRIVKLNTLTNTDRTCAKHNDLFLLCQAGCILTGVGRIEVRNICTSMAGIHHSEHRHQVILFPEVIHIQFRAVPHSGNILIAEAHLLCSSGDIQIANIRLQSFFHLHNFLDSLQEERCDLSDFVDLLDRYTTA